MANEIGLTAKIKPELDEREVERQAGRLEDIFQDRLDNLQVAIDTGDAEDQFENISDLTENITERIGDIEDSEIMPDVEGGDDFNEWLFEREEILREIDAIDDPIFRDADDVSVDVSNEAMTWAQKVKRMQDAGIDIGGGEIEDLDDATGDLEETMEDVEETMEDAAEAMSDDGGDGGGGSSAMDAFTSIITGDFSGVVSSMSDMVDEEKAARDVSLTKIAKDAWQSEELTDLDTQTFEGLPGVPDPTASEEEGDEDGNVLDEMMGEQISILASVKRGVQDSDSTAKGVASGVSQGLKGKMAGWVAKGMKGGLPGVAVKIALTGFVLQTLSTIKGYLDTLAGSSPKLGAVMDMFGMALQLFFRPFGNAAAGLLFPAMRSLLQLSADFNKAFSEGGLHSAVAMLIPAFGRWFGQVIGGIFRGILPALWDITKFLFALPAIIGTTIVDMLLGVGEGLFNVEIGQIGGDDMGWGQLIGGLIGAVSGAILSFFIGPFGPLVGAAIGSAFGVVIGYLIDVFPGWIRSSPGIIPLFPGWDTMMESMGSAAIQLPGIDTLNDQFSTAMSIFFWPFSSLHGLFAAMAGGVIGIWSWTQDFFERLGDIPGALADLPGDIADAILNGEEWATDPQITAVLDELIGMSDEIDDLDDLEAVVDDIPEIDGIDDIDTLEDLVKVTEEIGDVEIGDLVEAIDGFDLDADPDEIVAALEQAGIDVEAQIDAIDDIDTVEDIDSIEDIERLVDQAPQVDLGDVLSELETQDMTQHIDAAQMFADVAGVQVENGQVVGLTDDFDPGEAFDNIDSDQIKIDGDEVILQQDMDTSDIVEDILPSPIDGIGAGIVDAIPSLGGVAAGVGQILRSGLTGGVLGSLKGMTLGQLVRGTVKNSLRGIFGLGGALSGMVKMAIKRGLQAIPFGAIDPSVIFGAGAMGGVEGAIKGFRNGVETANKWISRLGGPAETASNKISQFANNVPGSSLFQGLRNSLSGGRLGSALSRLGSAARTAGRFLGPLGYAVEGVIRFFTDLGDFDFGRLVTRMIGGLSGAKIGAAIGGAIGSVIPGVGTTIGAVVGAVVGGVLGDILGGKVWDWLKDAWPGWPDVGGLWPGWPDVGVSWPGWPDIGVEWPGWPDLGSLWPGWSYFVPSISWTSWIPDIDWTGWIPDIGWDTFVPSIDWLRFVPGLQWISFISDLNWTSWIPSISWTDFIPDIGISDMVPSISVGDVTDEMLPNISVYDSLSGMFSFISSPGMGVGTFLGHLFSFSGLGLSDIFGGALGAIGGAVGKAGDAIGKAGDVVSGGISRAGDVASGAIDSAGSMASGAVDSAGDLVSGGLSSAGDMASGAISGAGDMASGAISRAGDMGSQAIGRAGNLASGAIGRAGDMGSQAIGMASDMASGAVNRAGEMTSQALGMAGDMASNAIGMAGDMASNAVGRAGDLASGAIDRAGDMAGNAIDFAGENASQALDMAGDMASDALDMAGEKASDALDMAGEFASESLEQASEFASDKLGEAGELASDALDEAGDLASSAIESGGDLAEGAFSSAESAIDSAGSSASSAISSAGDAISSAASSVSSSLSSAGSSVSSSLSSAASSIGLARGGIITQATPAVVGEGSEDEAVMPMPALASALSSVSGADISEGQAESIALSHMASPVQMAEGGIVTDSTFAEVGEGKEDEAVLPLSKLDSMLKEAKEDSGEFQEMPNIEGPGVITMEDESEDDDDESALGGAFSDALIEFFNAIVLSTDYLKGFAEQVENIDLDGIDVGSIGDIGDLDISSIEAGSLDVDSEANFGSVSTGEFSSDNVSVDEMIDGSGAGDEEESPEVGTMPVDEEILGEPNYEDILPESGDGQFSGASDDVFDDGEGAFGDFGEMDGAFDEFDQMDDEFVSEWGDEFQGFGDEFNVDIPEPEPESEPEQEESTSTRQEEPPDMGGINTFEPAALQEGGALDGTGLGEGLQNELERGREGEDVSMEESFDFDMSDPLSFDTFEDSNLPGADVMDELDVSDTFDISDPVGSFKNVLDRASTDTDQEFQRVQNVIDDSGVDAGMAMDHFRGTVDKGSQDTDQGFNSFLNTMGMGEQQMDQGFGMMNQTLGMGSQDMDQGLGMMNQTLGIGNQQMGQEFNQMGQTFGMGNQQLGQGFNQLNQTNQSQAQNANQLFQSLNQARQQGAMSEQQAFNRLNQMRQQGAISEQQQFQMMNQMRNQAAQQEQQQFQMMNQTRQMGAEQERQSFGQVSQMRNQAARQEVQQITQQAQHRAQTMQQTMQAETQTRMQQLEQLKQQATGEDQVRLEGMQMTMQTFQQMNDMRLDAAQNEMDVYQQLNDQKLDAADNMATSFERLFDTIETAADQVSQSFDNIASIMDSGADQIRSAAGNTAQALKDGKHTAVNEIEEAGSGALSNIGDAESSALSSISSAESSALSSIRSAADSSAASGGIVDKEQTVLVGEGGEDEVILPEGKFERMIQNAGQMGEGVEDIDGSLDGMVSSLGISVPHLADGGIVTDDTLARIGEEGDEAVIPLDQMDDMGMGETNIDLDLQQPDLGSLPGRDSDGEFGGAPSPGGGFGDDDEGGVFDEAPGRMETRETGGMQDDPDPESGMTITPDGVEGSAKGVGGGPGGAGGGDALGEGIGDPMAAAEESVRRVQEMIERFSETMVPFGEEVEGMTEKTQEMQVNTEKIEESINITEELVAEFRDTVMDVRQGIMETKQGFNEYSELVQENLATWDSMVKEGVSRLSDTFSQGGEQLSSAIETAVQQIGDKGDTEVGNVDSAGSDAVSDIRSTASSAISRVKSAASSAKDSVPGLASGGIVTKPTTALIGEGGESEAVMPLSKLESMMNGPGLGADNAMDNMGSMDPDALDRSMPSGGTDIQDNFEIDSNPEDISNPITQSVDGIKQTMEETRDSADTENVEQRVSSVESSIEDLQGTLSDILRELQRDRGDISLNVDGERLADTNRRAADKYHRTREVNK